MQYVKQLIGLLQKITEIEWNLSRSVKNFPLGVNTDSHKKIAEINKQLITKLETELEDIL